MQLRIVESHNGEGCFPLFAKGTKVENLNKTERYNHWMSCTINGMVTYVPDTYLRDNILITDYNPTELIVKENEKVKLLGLVFEWLLVKNKDNVCGWIPANKAVSVE